MQYDIDPQWALVNGLDDLSNFTGRIRAFTPEGNQIFENTLTDGLGSTSKENEDRSGGRVECETAALECTGEFDIWWNNNLGHYGYSYNLECVEGSFEYACDSHNGGDYGIDTGLNSGGGTGGYDYTDGYAGGGSGSGTGTGGTSGSSGSSGTSDDGNPVGVLINDKIKNLEANLWEDEKIDDSQLKPCMQS